MLAETEYTNYVGVGTYRIVGMNETNAWRVDLNAEYIGAGDPGEGPAYTVAWLCAPAGTSNDIALPGVPAYRGPSQSVLNYALSAGFLSLSAGGAGAGTPGADGAPGTNAYICISNVVTLAAGSAAYVSNYVDGATNWITFGIPAGSNGTDGAIGPAGTNADYTLVTNIVLAGVSPHTNGAALGLLAYVSMTNLNWVVAWQASTCTVSLISPGGTYTNIISKTWVE
jgi:hypothetical protein